VKKATDASLLSSFYDDFSQSDSKLSGSMDRRRRRTDRSSTRKDGIADCKEMIDTCSKRCRE